MKFKATQRRIACAVVLLPVLYVLNAGPLVFFSIRFGPPIGNTWKALYDPLYSAISGTALERVFDSYVIWWMRLAAQPKTETITIRVHPLATAKSEFP